MAYMPLSYVTGMYSTLDTVRARFVSCFQALYTAGLQLYGHGMDDVADGLCLSGTYGLQANAALTFSPATNNYRYYNNLAMTWILNNLDSTPTATVDMAGMIAAMFDAEYAEIVDWVGLLWAFQQILWDQPFFPDKYAEIVNRVRT